MDIEIEAFYLMPKESPLYGKVYGTLHAYIPQFGLDIRGIRVIRDLKKELFFLIQLPMFSTWDPEDAKQVIFPLFSFTDEERHVDFIKSIRAEGQKFLRNWHEENAKEAAAYVERLIRSKTWKEKKNESFKRAR